MDPERMHERCACACRVDKARLPDYQFRINGRGKATIVPEVGKEVWGVVWRITASNEEALDRCEGVKFGTYGKESVEVSLASGTTERVVTYIASDSSVGRSEPDYMERILTGAKEACLPRHYIDQLQEWATQETGALQ